MRAIAFAILFGAFLRAFLDADRTDQEAGLSAVACLTGSVVCIIGGW